MGSADERSDDEGRKTARANGARIEFAVVDPAEPDARFCLLAYSEELNERFDTGFDPAISISADVAELRAPHGVMLVAKLGTEPVGCGVAKFATTGVTEIKRMWISPAARGMGLARRPLAELETHAAAAGANVLRLETNRALTEAIALYRSAGYEEVEAFNDEPFAHHWFEKRLSETPG